MRKARALQCSSGINPVVICCYTSPNQRLQALGVSIDRLSEGAVLCRCGICISEVTLSFYE
ncbi:hypothetical protein DDF62_03160 [Caulobacter radicis]|nr:hypothetical protein DDF62_03160 [Caulobacter radicis]